MSKRTGERILKGLSPLFILLFLSFSTKGQELKSSVNKNVVRPGERLTYTLELKGATGKFDLPDFSAFKDVRGPSKSKQVRMINGQVSQTLKVSYILVVPDREGTIEIPPAKAKTQSGKILEASSLEVQVKKGGGSAGSHSSMSAGRRNGKLIGRIELNQKSAFKGEAVRVNYILFSRYRRISLKEAPEYPPIENVWTEELDQKEGKDQGVVEIDGKAYRKVILKRSLIFPQKAGTIKIDPMKVSLRIGHGFFNKGKVVNIKSNSTTLQVKPLPEGAPPSFEGAVGNYELKAELDQDTVKTNGSVNLKVKVSGSGNLALLGEPKVDIPSDLEHYDPNTKDKTMVGSTTMRGWKEWEYLIVPRQSGDYKISSITMSFFDPSKESYRTIRSGPFELRVKEEKAEGTRVRKGRKKANKEKVNVLDEKLRYIRTEFPDLQKKGKDHRGLFERSLPAIPPIFGALFFLLWSRWKKREGKGSIERKTARARLKDAEKALRKGDRSSFHEELFKGLQTYLSDRAGVPPAELSKQRLRERMEEMGIPKDLVNRSIRALEHSEMLRYAPSQNVSDEEVHEETVQLLAEIESHWK